MESLDDVFLWPDGTWCYREEYLSGSYNWLSDDFTVLSYDTEQYWYFFKSLDS